MTTLVLRTGCLLILLIPASTAMGQEVDWKTTVSEAADTLQHYLRFKHDRPPR